MNENEDLNQLKQRRNDDDTDERLMAAFVRGSVEAFNALFLRYKQPLFGFFCRRIADRSHAEELTQETFLAILRARERYEATALFRTYLYAIAQKILRSYRRKTAFRATFSGMVPGDREPGLSVAIDAEIALREAVRRLDRIDREILLLREYEELSYLEIAVVLAIPVNTVRSRLFRARMALRDLLTAPAASAKAQPLSKREEHA
ncbi:MAG TPA: sigma-70 family RNA polymerase sigma factor [Acidobacteriaceae bacterium]